MKKLHILKTNFNRFIELRIDVFMGALFERLLRWRDFYKIWKKEIDKEVKK